MGAQYLPAAQTVGAVRARRLLWLLPPDRGGAGWQDGLCHMLLAAACPQAVLCPGRIALLLTVEWAS